ncbi:MAG: Arc family DNA-binding protein [Lachnospirales bacterium]
MADTKKDTPKNVSKEKKQIPLRISKSLWVELNQWAEDDFRSINGQIEFILTEAVKKRKKKEDM